MKQVLAFMTSDGKVHSNKIDALFAECRIEIRGYYQSFMPRTETLSIAQVVDMNIQGGSRLTKIIQKHEAAIRRFQASEAKKDAKKRNKLTVTFA